SPHLTHPRHTRHKSLHATPRLNSWHCAIRGTTDGIRPGEGIPGGRVAGEGDADGMRDAGVAEDVCRVEVVRKVNGIVRSAVLNSCQGPRRKGMAPGMEDLPGIVL